MQKKIIAENNLDALKNNLYPGRIIILGMEQSGKYAVQVYAITGRSDQSRNRIFVCDKEGEQLETKAADPSKVKDPSLIIYKAMNDLECNFVVSNGHQTDVALRHLVLDDGMSDSIKRSGELYQYEPDPSHTPRITGLICLEGQPFAEIIIIKKAPFSDACDKQLFRYNELLPGYGHCISTYEQDGDPLPSFKGEPYLLPLNGDIEAIANEIWDSLNEANRVALAVKFINIVSRETKIHIINKYTAVE